MRTDRCHIKMEDLSRFNLERSTDCEDWEDVSNEELTAILDQESDDKTKTFLGVIRGGSQCLLRGYFYRIRPQS